jgi:thiamine biosynthesis protein ThiI
VYERVILVNYHEIGLKGRNRGRFERVLQDNLAAALGDLAPDGVERVTSRLVVPVAPAREERALEVARHTPGVASAAIALVVSREPRAMEHAAVLAIHEADPQARTFAIQARRSATDYAERSLAMNRRIGAAVQAELGLAVDLGAPDVTCRVEVVQGEVYVSARRVPGPGGLPVSTSGKVLALLSAGIDSPVAAWRVMRRGAVLVAVHFSGRPHSDARSEYFAREIADRLSQWYGIGRLYIVPFGDLQREISLAAPPDLRILLYRRLMVRIAERIASEEHAKALVTGESLGQVASQTLENIAAVDAAATLPVLRPLVGSDKQEIIAEARRLGTYELSTRPHADCCTLFMPRTPETHATVAQVEAGEADLDLQRMVSDALSLVSYVDYPCPSYRAPSRWPAEGEGRS